MTPEQLYQKLKQADQYWINPPKAGHIILRQPELFSSLLEICYNFEDDASPKACWVLEFICKRELDRIFPYLDGFIANLSKFKYDASIRSMAKISRLLIKDYFDKKPSPVKVHLTEAHLERLTEVNFDWLISNQKVAIKSHAIHNLYELGKKWDWVYPELRMVLEQNMHRHSAAYQAAARNTLRKIPG